MHAHVVQIWEECDPTGSGSVGRDALYKSMALCGLGQQGKGVGEKTLLNYGDAGMYVQVLLQNANSK